MGASLVSDSTALADTRWAACAGASGLIAVGSYIAVSAVSASPPVAVLLTFVFSFGLTVASVSLHLGVTIAVAPRLGILAAVANALAAGQLTAMLLVQMAVRQTEPRPERAFIAIWLGLDVSWDLFVGAGTVLFGLALWRHPYFRPLVALSGVVVGLCLLALNIATFPTPPAEAGLLDVGPIVGLWYVLLSIRVLILVRRTKRREAPA